MRRKINAYLANGPGAGHDEANARLSELVKRAQQQPQQLTSHAAPVAFIRRSPPVGVDVLDLERSSDFTKDMEL